MYVITGGYDSKAKPAYVSTTEILTEGDSKWKVVGSLPVGLKSSRVVSVENSVILTGNKHTIYFSVYFSIPLFILKL